MFKSELPKDLRKAVERNRKAHNKRIGKPKDYNNNVESLNQTFDFAFTPEGELFWWVVAYTKNAHDLSFTTEYKDFKKNNSKKRFERSTLFLSLLLYCWLGYLLLTWLAEKDILTHYYFR